MATVYIQGHCPSCGSESLILGLDHHLVCSRLDCPRPDAITDLLERFAAVKA